MSECNLRVMYARFLPSWIKACVLMRCLLMGADRERVFVPRNNRLSSLKMKILRGG